MDKQMLMSILDELDGSLDDSVMGDVAKAKPEACITIRISGAKPTIEEGPAKPEEDEKGDALDRKFASVSRGRSDFDGE